MPFLLKMELSQVIGKHQNQSLQHFFWTKICFDIKEQIFFFLSKYKTFMHRAEMELIKLGGLGYFHHQ